MIETKEFEEGNTTINYNGNIFGQGALYPDRFPQDLLLKPLVEYKLSKKGYSMIHSAAVRMGLVCQAMAPITAVKI